MPTQSSVGSPGLVLELTRQIDQACDAFEIAFRAGAGFDLAPFLGRVEPPGHAGFLYEVVPLAITLAAELGRHDPVDALLTSNPGLRQQLVDLIRDLEEQPTELPDDKTIHTGRVTGLVIRCPHCHSSIEMIVDASLVDIGCTICGGRFSLVNDEIDTRSAHTLSKVAHFELIERLGMGEFGTVWKARDTMLDRTVAVKIPRRLQLDADSIEKFMREARAAAQLRHPNIISTHEVGRDQDTLYIVNDYVRGVPLSEVIADHRLPLHDTIEIVTTVADALSHAHQSGIVHRDLKPSNILIDDFGAPHLMDFGLAKRKEPGITMTTEGVVLGTPAYMSPEQARGEAAHVDGRTDIYSLGVILFQLLTGELPFRGSARMLLHKVINQDAPGPRSLEPQVSKDLDTICMKCMEKEPAKRYATAEDLAEDLRRYKAGKPIVARRIGLAGRMLRWARRNPAIATSIASVVAILSVATIVSAYFAWQAARNASLADKQTVAMTDTLYDSLLQEMQLTREVRQQGYGARIHELVHQARNLPTLRLDKNELRRQLVLSMGDFVAFPPQQIKTFTSPVTAIGVDPTSKNVLVGHVDGTITIYDAATCQVVDQFSTAGAPILAMQISGDAQQLIVADEAGNVCEFKRDTSDWKLTRDFKPGFKPQSAAFSPDGQFVGVASTDQFEIWNIATGLKEQSLPIEAGRKVRNIAFEHSEPHVFGGYVNQQTDSVGWARWNYLTGESLPDFECPGLGETYPTGIAVSKDGGRLAIGFDEALLRFDAPEMQQSVLSQFGSIIAVAFDPANANLAAANIRGRINIWDGATNQVLAKLELPTPSATYINLAFSADGSLLVASHADLVQIWDLTRANEKTVMAGHRGAIPAVVFHPDGTTLATGAKDNNVRFWNSNTGDLLGNCEIGEPVETLAYSADGRWLAVGSMGKVDAPHLRIVDTRTSNVVLEKGATIGEVLSLAWSTEGPQTYLAGAGERGLEIWDFTDREGPSLLTQLYLPHKSNGRYLATAFSRATNVLVGADENHIEAWNPRTGKKYVLTSPGMNQGWRGIALLPDGRSVVYVSHDGTAEVWDIKANSRKNSIGKRDTFTNPYIALSPDGEWLAALLKDDVASVWHVATGDHLLSLRPATGAIWSLAWDPSGNNLAIGQSDGGLSVWHLPKIQEKLKQANLSW